MDRKGERRARRRARLRDTRLHLVLAALVLVLASAGLALVREAMLRNTYETGTTLSRIYAAEEAGDLTVYETLLTVATTSIDSRAAQGESGEDIAAWLAIYFQRLDSILGSGMVNPYAVLEGEIVAAHPWEGDKGYPVEDTEWYQKALEADGEAVFTDVYTDAATGQPVITAAQKCRDCGAVVAFDILSEKFLFNFGTFQLPEGNSFFLCDSTGRVIYRETALEAEEAVIQAYLDELIVLISQGELDGYRSNVTDLSGQRRAVYYTRMGNGWYSIVTRPYSTILGPFYVFAGVFGLLILAALGGLAAMAWRDLRLGARVRRTNETVRVLGNSYYALYRVDYEAETYEMIKGSDYVRGRIPPQGDYDSLLKTASEVIEADAYRDFIQSFSCEKIRVLVKGREREFGGDFLRLFGEEYRWVNVRVLYDESLAPGEVVLAFREVGAQKQRQLQERKLLEDALDLARSNEASKQAFFRNMSHDMRTPLNAILSLSALAEQHAGDPEKVRGYLKKIGSSGQHLLGLINDILDMSRLEQGKIVLDSRSFDLKACLEESLETFRIQAEEQGKGFTTDLELENPQVMGDPFRLQQVLNNLLSNALKFTGKGDSITVTARQVRGGDQPRYRLEVADTGIGMSAEFLQRLFEPYARELRFSAAQAGGTGLGMAITKSLVAQMDGEISVQSQPGEGTVFTLVLPFAAARPEAVPPEPEKQDAPSLEGLRVLVAEDNEVNMEIVTELLAMAGAQVTQAWNGKEAVELFQESPPYWYQAVLLDMQMPVLDGCGAARQIRALKREDAAAVPLIAATANVFPEDIAATAAAGMDAHVAKPIDFTALRDTLSRLAGRGRGM